MTDNTLHRRKSLKMSMNLKAAILNLIINNRRLFLLYTATLIIGIIVGSVTYLTSNQDSANKIFSYIQNYFTGSTLIGISFTEVFKSAMLDNLKLTFVLFISSLSVFLCPISFIRIFSKGFGMGMTVTFFIARYMIKGVIFSVLSVFLCNVIIVPSIIIFSAHTLSESIKMFKFSKSRNLKHQDKLNGDYFKFFIRCILNAAVLAVILIAAAMVQGFICPGIMRIFYMIVKS